MDGFDLREAASNKRDDAADVRDTRAAERDRASDLRDLAATERDAEAARMRGVESTAETAPEALMRRNALADREWSSESRGAAETERGQSAADRDSSAADRRAATEERANAAMDALTGAYLRGPGIAELEREMVRSVRLAMPLLLAFLDVDALKTVNDQHGHAAGDRLLIAVVRVLRETLRPYDRVVRYGGDEFLCVLSGLTEAEATARFSAVNSALAAGPDPGSVSVGFAMMEAGDTVATLVARADHELYRSRGRS